MDPLPQQRRWTGLFVTFYACAAAACGAVRRNKSSNGSAPQCLTGPGRADDHKSWYRMKAYDDEPATAAEARERDAADQRARIAIIRATEIKAARVAAGGSAADKNAAKKACIDEYVRIAREDEASRRQYLADELGVLCSHDVYQTAIKQLPASCRCDGVAILLLLHEDCAPVGNVADAELEREKLSDLIWTEPTLKKHIAFLNGAFNAFETATATELTQAQKHYYLLKSLRHADSAYSNHVKLLTPTLDKDGSHPYTSTSRWLRDNDGDRSPSGDDAKPPPAAFACDESAHVAPQPGCVECGSTDHSVSQCPRRDRTARHADKNKKARGPDAAKKAAWLADSRDPDDPPGGWTPRKADEKCDPKLMPRGMRRHRERCLADPKTHGEWDLSREQPPGGYQDRAHLAHERVDDVDATIDAWAAAGADGDAADDAEKAYMAHHDVSATTDPSPAICEARAVLAEQVQALELTHRTQREQAEALELDRLQQASEHARAQDQLARTEMESLRRRNVTTVNGAADEDSTAGETMRTDMAYNKDKTGAVDMDPSSAICKARAVLADQVEALELTRLQKASEHARAQDRLARKELESLRRRNAISMTDEDSTAGKTPSTDKANNKAAADDMDTKASGTLYVDKAGVVNPNAPRRPTVHPARTTVFVSIITLCVLLPFLAKYAMGATDATKTNTSPDLGVYAPTGYRNHPRPDFDSQYGWTDPGALDPRGHAIPDVANTTPSPPWNVANTPSSPQRPGAAAGGQPWNITDYAPLARVSAGHGLRAFHIPRPKKASIATETGRPDPPMIGTVVVVCDSGASCSCFNHIDFFTDFTQYPAPRSIGVANGGTASIVGIGTVRLLATDEHGRTIIIELRQCRLVPEFEENLLAVIPGLTKGTVLHLEDGNSYVRSGGPTGAKIPVNTQGSLPTITCTRAPAGDYADSQYACHVFTPSNASSATKAAAAASAKLHCDMGHFNLNDILECAKRGRLRVSSDTQTALLRDKAASRSCLCTACAQTKLHVTPVTPSKVHLPRPDAPSARRPGPTRCCERWSADFIDVPHACIDRLGKPTGHTMRYGLVCCDHFSGQILVHFVKTVKDAPAALKHLIDQCHARGQIKDLNNCNMELTLDTQLYASCAAYCDAQGIHRRAVSAGDHRFNRAESAIRTLRFAAEAMRFHAQLPGSYAPAATCYAAHIANMLGRKSHGYVSTYETAYGFVPDASELVEFGTICAVLVEQEARGDPRAVFALSAGARQSRSGIVGGFPDVSKDGSHTFLLPDAPWSPRHSRNFKKFATGLEELGRETVVRRLNLPLPPSRHARKKARADILADLAARAADDADAGHAYTSSHAHVFVPRSHHQARKSSNADKWRAAEEKEVNGQLDKGTWQITDYGDRDPDAPILQMIMAYRFKPPTSKCPDGVFKARCCPDGSKLKAGVHFGQYAASSPVADRASIRTLLALCCLRCLKLESLDLEQAYLQQSLPDDQVIYVKCPPGHTAYGKDNKPQLWRAKKTCYGLPWAGQALYESLTDWLRRLGARPTAADPCVWTWSGTTPDSDAPSVGELLCAITVDDIIFGGSNEAINKLFITKMSSQFKLTHDHHVEHVLGLDIVERSDGATRTIAIDTSQLIEDLAADHGLQGLPPVDNPSPSNPSYDKWPADNDDEATFYLINKRYRALTGSITYIATVGRPDIAHASAMVSRHNHNPGPKAFAAAKRIVSYLLATKDNKLTYSGPTDHAIPWDRIGIKLYVDSDHQGADEKSQTGMATYLTHYDASPQSFCGGAIDWMSKRQGCLAQYPQPPNPVYAEDDSISVAGHSSDAELIALSDAVPRGRHHRMLLREMGATQPAATNIYSDSLPAIKFVHCDTSPSLKHMNARVRQIREMLRLGVMTYHHLPGNQNNSDALTKRLPSTVYGKHAHTLMGIDCALPKVPVERYG